MSKTVILIVIILISVLTLAGVQKYRGKPAVTPTPSARGGQETQIMSQEKLIEKLTKEKLADFLKIDIGQIEIVKTEKVDWPDASLGAPEEGMMYAQVITPGYKVTMITGSTLYEVHTNEEGTGIVLVQNGKRLTK